MEFNIKQQKQNPLLHREEYLIEINSNNNPTKKQIIDFLKKPEELIIINQISNSFGSHKFIADVFIYESKEKKQEIQIIPQKVEEEAKAKEEAEKAKSEESKEEEKPNKE